MARAKRKTKRSLEREPEKTKKMARQKKKGDGSSGVRMPPLQRYKTSDPFCGLMVIINNVKFDKAGGHPKRAGSEKDVDRLRKTFGQLGFEIQIQKDRTCCNMFQDLKDVANRSNRKKFDCLAVVILTHGGDGNIICGVGNGADECTIDKVLQPLKKIKKEMPKLVFVQACRGNKLDEGHDVMEGGVVGSNGRWEKECIRVPIEADLLYHYSSSPGFSSIRNRKRGSVFIQELCNVYDKYIEQGDEFDVLIPHVEINRRVAETKIKDSHSRQMPSFVSMMRKHLFLKRMA